MGRETAINAFASVVPLSRILLLTDQFCILHLHTTRSPAFKLEGRRACGRSVGALPRLSNPSKVKLRVQSAHDLYDLVLT